MNNTFLKCIPSVYIPVKNLEKSSQWWIGNFNLEFVVPLKPESEQAILKLGDGQWLHLVKTRGDQTTNFISQKDGVEYDMFSLTFEVREIEKLYQRCVKNGVKIEGLELRKGCGINFRFYDPDGNKYDVNENIYMHRTEFEIEKVLNEMFVSNTIEV
ncbi:VOC family protein [Cytobacillus pseudoceanisediminis]|uniref:VOC family protein n=1 Tax=Cytobacillus pseudoceanisediminis TaxID=3051614 RepID=UPI003C2DBD30